MTLAIQKARVKHNKGAVLGVTHPLIRTYGVPTTLNYPKIQEPV